MAGAVKNGRRGQGAAFRALGVVGVVLLAVASACVAAQPSATSTPLPATASVVIVDLPSDGVGSTAPVMASATPMRTPAPVRASANPTPAPTSTFLQLPNLDLMLIPGGDAGTQLGIVAIPLDLKAPGDPAITDATVIASVTDPSGKVRRYPLPDEGLEPEGGIGDGEYGAYVWGTTVPGKYTVEVTVTGQRYNKTLFTAKGSATIQLAPGQDADGDGVTDQTEQLLQMDPNDPADGAMDPDGDGLSVAKEIAVGTAMFEADTDGGGENDGAELAAGRDPLDRSDDVRKKSCFYGTPESSARPTMTFAATYPRDTALENTLPRTILGYPTQRISGAGPGLLAQYPYGALATVVLVCVHKPDSDGSWAVAYAGGSPARYDALMAIRVKGVTGAEMEQALLDVRPGEYDLVPPRSRTVNGKTYRVYAHDTFYYTTLDTVYFLISVPSENTSTPTPIIPVSMAPTPTSPTRMAIFDDIVRQLP